MEFTQSFRLIGSMDVEEIPCDLIDGHYAVSWEDIEQVFPGVKHVKNGKVTVPMMKDPNRKRIVPHCIKHHAGVVLDVILSPVVGHVHVDSSMATPANSQDDTPANPPANLPGNPPTIPCTDTSADTSTNAPTDALTASPAATPPVNPSTGAPTNVPVNAPTNAPTDTLNICLAPILSIIPPADAPADDPTNPFSDDPVNLHTSADAAINAPPSSPANASTNLAIDAPANPPRNNQTNNQPDACPSGVIVDVFLANPPHSSSSKGTRMSSPMALAKPTSNSAVTMKTSNDHLSTGPCQEFQSAVIHRLDAIHDQGAMTHQIARKVLELSEEMKDRLVLIQSKTEAILNQQLELAEYPIPRLFIVLPEELTKYHPGNWCRTKFRLHFICECGKHTEPNNSKVPHHLHLAKHKGYLVREPTKFFKKYGPFLLFMLQLIKFGTSIAGHVVPALASLKVVELIDSVKQPVELVTAKIDYSLECIDNQLAKVQASSPRDFIDSEPRAALTQQDFTNYLSDVEGLEGVELRQLGSFLMTSEENLLGNLYRMTTSEGHVKWVCRDHYRASYQEKYTQKLRDVVNLAHGKFDEQLGRVEIVLNSKFMATEFYDAVTKAKGAIELIVIMDWGCTRNDLEALENALRDSRVSILRLHLRQFHSTILLSTSAQYAAIGRMRGLRSMQKIHITLPGTTIKLPQFESNKGAHLCVVSAKCTPQRMKGSEFRTLVETLKTNSFLIALDLSYNEIGHNGVVALSEALKINSTLNSLNLSNNKIGDYGLVVMSEAFKDNSTLTTLNLSNNLIGLSGAQALSKALNNSALISLGVWCNKIGDNGAQALSDSLRTNLTLTTLNLESNSIGDIGAQALSDALKTNSTLINMSLESNQIGDKGAKALSEAFKNNSSLTILCLWGNSIGPKGAKALRKAEKTTKCSIFQSCSRNDMSALLSNLSRSSK
ncbi:hypothetical protein BGZ89_012384 [Linnemannia elongata]|nr:hypothetical protein BGZ89_012384 [Linnemannia elongata]